MGPQCVIFSFLQLGIAYTPTGTFASRWKLSRPTAHPSGLSGFLLARATWLPESSPVRAAADAESRSPWDPNEGTRHLGTSGTWRGGAGRAGRLARGPAASREESRPEARQKGRVSSTVPFLRERDLAGWKSCTREPLRRAAHTMERAGPSSVQPKQQRDQDWVEAWLDDHRDFTFSYFVRKATR